ARPKTVPVPPPLPLTFEGGTTFGLAETVAPSVTGLLVPVVCSLCGTRMYAGENEIGGFKTCPDCGRQTEIKSVPKSERIQPVISPNGGYGVSQSEVPEQRPVFRTLTDYRYIEGSLDKELYDKKKRDNTKEHDETNEHDDIKEHYNTKIPPPLPVLYNPNTPTVAKNNGKNNTENNAKQKPDSETLRERRAAKQTGLHTNRDILKMVQRTSLPKHPFLNRIFVPFFDAGLLGRTITASLLCIAGVLGGTLLPAMLNLNALYVVLSVPFGVVTFMLGLSLLANTYHSLFLWTTIGNDLPERDDWQEYRLLESGSLAVWLFLLAILAASPGYLLLSSVSVIPEWTSNLSIRQALVAVSLLLGSFNLFFPVFFLSSMEAGSYFVVLSKETCRSLINYSGVWLWFYFISFLLSALFCLIILAVSLAIPQILAGISLLIPIGSVFSLFHARFLGRLGWILEESAHQLFDEENDEP
ncbi:MAG: hypothetical protein LBK82_09445, partial [Planctomycetaceae bacterium]|nr:hypothetical protein [Planctomycetaceae bacterium]